MDLVLKLQVFASIVFDGCVHPLQPQLNVQILEMLTQCSQYWMKVFYHKSRDILYEAIFYTCVANLLRIAGENCTSAIFTVNFAILSIRVL